MRRKRRELIYDVVPTNEFNKSLNAIIELTIRSPYLEIRKEILELWGRLLNLRKKPRQEGNWTHRFHITCGYLESSAVEIPKGHKINEASLINKNEWISYTIEESLFGDETARRRWGQVVVTYRVIPDDRKVILTSIDVFPAYDLWQ